MTELSDTAGPLDLERAAPAASLAGGLIAEPASGGAPDGPATEEVVLAAERITEAQDTGESIDAYVTTLEELGGLLLEDASLEQLLAHVLELTSRAVTPSAAVSVTIVGDDGGYRTAAASSNDAVTLDELQYELREGPCVDALETGREHLVQDLDVDGPWPRFRDRAREVGFGSLLALPLLAGTRPVGALNVFAADPQGFTEQDVQLARRIAAPAAATLANARAYRRVARLTEQLQQALQSRAVIEQAKGVLVAQRRCDPDEAFALLREASQDHNRKLRDIAQAVIASSYASNGNGGNRTNGATT